MGERILTNPAGRGRSWKRIRRGKRERAISAECGMRNAELKDFSEAKDENAE